MDDTTTLHDAPAADTPNADEPNADEPGLEPVADAQTADDDKSRGAVLIEAVLLMTLMLTLFFGILEFGLAIRERNGLSEATRTGVRAASSLSRQDGYHTAAAEAVSTSLRGLDIEDLTLSIYKADPITGNPLNGNLENCNFCYRFVWNSNTESFEPVTGVSWPATDQAACGIGGTNDYVGVYLAGHYDMVTTFWSEHIQLAEKAVMRLEPITHNAICQ